MVTFLPLLWSCAEAEHQGRKHVAELSCFMVARKQQERQEKAVLIPTSRA